MQNTHSRRSVLSTVMAVVMIILVLFVASLLAVLLSTDIAESPTIVPTPLGQVAVLSTASPVLSETSSPPSLSATWVATRTPSSTELVQPTVTSTAPVQTLPEPSATAVAAPTLATTPTVPAATPVPTLVPPTGTPSLSISRVSTPRTYIYDGPSTNNSIIGGVENGDELVVLGSSGTWYLVRMNDPRDGRTRIEGGQGWIAQDQVSPPTQPVPMVNP